MAWRPVRGRLNWCGVRSPLEYEAFWRFVGIRCSVVGLVIRGQGAEGKDLGGRRIQFTDSQIRMAHKLIQSGESVSRIAKDLGMSRATLYHRLKEL